MEHRIYYVGDVLECSGLDVYCDGERLDKVVTFSFDGGFAECVTVNDAGDVIHDNYEILTHKVYGLITVGKTHAK